MELFIARNESIDRRIAERNAVIDARLIERSAIMDRRFEEMMGNCSNNQKRCSDALCSRINLNADLLTKQMEGYNIRLNDGDEIFKSDRHYKRAVILTLLQMCGKLEIDCDKLTKTFVHEDLM